jgi:hypothetical protein
MRRSPLLLAPLLLGAVPASAVTPMSPLRCTTLHAINQSIGEPTGLEGTSSVISPADLRVEDRHFTATLTTHDTHGSETVSYRIARAGLAFEATALRHRNDIGEEHIIRMSGTCVTAAP